MIQSKTILFQQQQEIADQLNSYNRLAGKVEFVPENQKDIEFQIKKALGSQGIVGVVMTPKARYQGISYDKAQVWDLIDVTVQIIENPIVNRTLPEDRITALDAAVYASEAMSSPLHSKFGDYCPTQIEQGENSGLIVAQFKFSCTVREDLKEWTRLYFDDGSLYKADWNGQTSRQMLEDALSASGHALQQLAGVKSSSLVTGIGEKTFLDAPGLKWIDFSDALTYIGVSAFQGCAGLQGVDVPSSVRRIEDYAFAGCASLRGIGLQEGLEYIGIRALSGCSSLSGIEIPDSVVSAGYQTLAYCTNCEYFKAPQAFFGDYSIGGTFWTTRTSPKRVVASEGVQYIGTANMNGCAAMEDVQLPSSLTAINSQAFANCTGLLSVRIPDSVQQMQTLIFSNCSSLTAVQLPAGLTAVPNSTFARCTSLVSVDIPESVDSIGSNAFQQCESLREIEIAGRVQTIGNGAFLSAGLSSVVIDGSVGAIPARAFYQCGNLKKIVVGDSVQSIGNQAFSYAGGGELTLGAGLTSIANTAFRDNLTTEDIYLYADPMALTWNPEYWTFKTDGSTRVHVTADSLATWQANFGAANVTFVGDLEA